MNYPPPERIASPTELRQYYEKAVAEIDSLRNTRRSERAVSSKNRQEALESRKQVKKLSREVVTLPKSKKPKRKQTSAVIGQGQPQLVLRCYMKRGA